MKINLDTPGDDARIEIIPLIDVIFCILTFFLLAALQLTRQQAISVDLPKASSGTPQMREMLMVSLDDFGQIYVEQQQINSKDQLTQSLQNYRSTNPNGLMVLYASRTASYNDVIQVLDLLRDVGGDRVSLATLPGSGDAAAGSNTQVPTAPSPGLAPYSGNAPIQPYNPYAPPSPSANPYNLGQPQLPVAPGQPEINPTIPGTTIPGTVPVTPTVPAPQGTDSAPKR
ncbi:MULTISPECIES: biopolymer transporter ExbD [unclassified Coleofasciculus]|uniref:ExbD/TolR family protein n=1 Tax=Cyanophyceae TaxID=3028117 RepID=UPI0016822D05|nr:MULTISPECIES: biopolymer transporter ExbD [unclassified Coleofasciculus]MBD1881722.1 biopolymer transporter ExbD [Coleofasciculus sp. FACHB-T130]MBD1888245.1 biopolymer transporter ExbD [Coleofasciculus sp. FACHB-SPT9]MBD1900195.1 biopolymer transporter ExbD [Coleofasciculus sp. FACHB-125]MBD2087765.1 biopolymer transporter ExbD [Coleofasciculus sp. FACHB-542]